MFFSNPAPRKSTRLLIFGIWWFKDDDIEKGEIPVHKFARHVWGIISSFIACNSIHELTEHNPTNASMLTLHTIRFSTYMDDLLYSTDTLDKAQTISYESVSFFRVEDLVW